MTVKLVYTGTVATVFTDLNAVLQPGQTFQVPDDQAEAYLSRGDIEPAADHEQAEPEDLKPAPAKPSKSVPAEPAAN